MKKFFFLAVLALATCSLHAQISIGVHAGGIGAKTTSDADDDADVTIDRSFRPSWKQGLVFSIPFMEKFSFMPQLNILSKGGKLAFKNQPAALPIDDTTAVPITIDFEGESRYTYLELPLNLVYNSNSETGSFFAGIGPAISFGLGGQIVEKTKIKFQDQEIPELSALLSGTYDVKFDGEAEPADDDVDMHRKSVEFGANALAGYRFANGFFIMANYHRGLSNINPSDDSKTKNQYFGISIGVFIGNNNGY